MPIPETALRPVPRARSEALLRRLNGLSIVVVGDLMLDHFIFGRVNRISPEAPVPVVEFDHEDFRVGGAGNVAHNARALGASVELVGLLGCDEHGARVKDALQKDGIGTAGLVSEDRWPTTLNARIV